MSIFDFEVAFRQRKARILKSRSKDGLYIVIVDRNYEGDLIMRGPGWGFFPKPTYSLNDEEAEALCNAVQNTIIQQSN